jgi:hypothetical protein
MSFIFSARARLPAERNHPEVTFVSTIKVSNNVSPQQLRAAIVEYCTEHNIQYTKIRKDQRRISPTFNLTGSTANLVITVKFE